MISKDDLILECEIIGSFINDSSTHEYLHRLKEDDFLDDTNRKLFKTLLQLQSKKEDINIFTLHDKSKISISQISNITAIISTTANIEPNIKLLKDKSNRRKLVQKANLIINMAKDTSKDIGEVKNDALREIEELEDVISEEVITLSKAMVETTLILDDRYLNKDDKSYYTGITKLDIYMAGLHKEELTTIGARPGVGKTILGMQIALNIARNKKKVMFTSLEMSVTQICERILASNTNIDSLRLRTGNIKDDEWGQAHKVAAAYSLDSFLLDKTSRNTQHIRTKLRKYKPDLLVIDYLQLLQSSTKEYSREREVATITRDLKLMSLEFKIPIVILSQLNRNAEGNRPTMADLRESGAIEQDSDNIIFIHEPNEKEVERLVKSNIYDYTFFDLLEKNNQKLSQLIIEKQRNGPVGTMDVIKVPRIMRFVEIDKNYKEG